MRIGVYIGQWSLTRLGGMGVYLQDLLKGAIAVRSGDDIVLLVDECNRAAADELCSDLRVITMDRPPAKELDPLEMRRALRVRALSYRDETRAERTRSDHWSSSAEAFIWGLDDAVTANRIDVLYFTIAPYVKKPRVPYVLTLHDLKHIHRPQDHDRADLARRRRWGRVARSASRVYASYEHVRHDITQYLNVAHDRASVIPCACPTKLDGATKAPLPPPESDLPEKYILMPAQFWPHKNHRRVIEAIALLHERGLDVAVVFTGQMEGECAAHADEVRRYARQLNVTDRILFKGFVERDEMRSLYARARAILVATLYDPGSLPVMEALAMGKPLVASRVTSIPETVGDAAILFNPQCTFDLATALRQAWTDDDVCRILSKRGRTQLPHRSWKNVAADWLDLCRRAASEGSTPLSRSTATRSEPASRVPVRF